MRWASRILLCVMAAAAACAKPAAARGQSDAGASGEARAPAVARPPGPAVTYKSLQEALAHPDDVRELNAGRQAFSPEVEKLPQLEVLTMAGPLPEQPLRLPKLKRLTITSTLGSFESLPEWVGQLSSLEELTVTCSVKCPATFRLPPSTGRLSSLQALYIEKLPIAALPKELGDLAKLESLTIRNGKALKVLPPEIGRLTSLRTLIVDRAGLESLPLEITALKKLKTLQLNNNKLRQLPWSELGRLPDLTRLEVSGNALEDYPKQIGALESQGGGTYLAAATTPVARYMGPLDPQEAKKELLSLAAQPDRSALFQRARALGLVPARDDQNKETVSDNYFARDTAVSADVFLANLFGDATPEAVLQLRTSKDLATREYYALAFFYRKDGAWMLHPDTVIEDGRSTDGPYLRFSFQDVTGDGTKMVVGVVLDARLGGNERSEMSEVVVWRVDEGSVTEAAREDLSETAYKSAQGQVTKDVPGTFRFEPKKGYPKKLVIQRGSKRKVIDLVQ